MNDFCERHQVVEPHMCENVTWCIAMADSAAEDGQVVKARDGDFDRDPSTCQLQIVNGVVLNPFYYSQHYGWVQL